MIGDKSGLLKEVSIFSGLDQEHLERIVEQCGWNRVEKGCEVLQETDPTSDVFFILQGAVSAKSFSLNGKEVTYSDIRAGQMFGEFSAIDRMPRSATVCATEDSVIARLSSDDFRAVLSVHPEVGVAFAEHLVVKLRKLTQRVFEFSTMSVRHRIYAELLRLCDGQGVDGETVTIEPAPTHYEFATRISTHREAVSREFSQLEAEGVLAVSRKRIAVLDTDRLRGKINI